MLTRNWSGSWRLNSIAPNRQNLGANKEDLTLFLRMSVPAGELDQVRVAAPAARKVAGLAYQFGLERIVQTPASKLRRQLTQMGVDLDNESVDLLDQLPCNQPQSDRQWAARRALFEYQQGRPLEYQGQGSAVIRADEEADFAKLATELLSANSISSIGEFGAELGLPEFQQFRRKTDDKAWFSRVTTGEAEREGFRGVLVVLLGNSLTSANVHVDAHMLAMQSPGSWFEVAHFRSSAKRCEPGPYASRSHSERPSSKGGDRTALKYLAWELQTVLNWH